MKYEKMVRSDVGGWAKECMNCHGEGYVQVGSTVEPDENEQELCGECEGSGVVDTSSDTSDDYREQVTEF